MYFQFTDQISDFLFKGWSAYDTGTILAVCVFVTVLAIILELLSLLNVYIQKKARVNPLRFGEEEGDSSQYPVTLRALLIPPSVSAFRWRKIKLHILQTVNHVFHLVIGYLLMLAVMTYNGYVLIAVIIGSAVGYYILGPLKISYLQSPRARHIPESRERVDASESSPDHQRISASDQPSDEEEPMVTEATIESYQRGPIPESEIHSSC